MLSFYTRLGIHLFRKFPEHFHVGGWYVAQLLTRQPRGIGPFGGGSAGGLHGHSSKKVYCVQSLTQHALGSNYV